jgi:hypothetical protein
METSPRAFEWGAVHVLNGACLPGVKTLLFLANGGPKSQQSNPLEILALAQHRLWRVAIKTRCVKAMVSHEFKIMTVLPLSCAGDYDLVS